MRKKKMAVLAIVLTAALMIGIMPAKIALADTFGMTGSGTAADPYVVVTAQQLDNLHTLPLNACFRLGNNIDCTAIGCPTTIGNTTAPYSGTFDGAGYTISHVSYNLTGDTVWAGLISYGQGAVVKNLTIIGTVSGGTLNGTGNQFGAIAAYFNGSIINCNANITVTSRSAVGTIGGLVGTLSNGSSITNSKATLSMTSATGQGYGYAVTIGGLCGQANNSQISGCSSNVNINVTSLGSTYVGGLCGYVFVDKAGNDIYDCHSNATIVEHNSTDGEGYTGGLIGCVSNNGYTFTIDKCYSDGSVSGTDVVGGLIGYTSAPSGTPTTITNSYSDAGAASSYVNDDYVGGFIGWNATACARNCYSLGSITFDVSSVPTDHSTFAGGFAGYIGASLYNCYSAGSATIIGTKTAWDYIGGFAGHGGNGSYCYYNTTTIPDLLGVIGGNNYTTGLSTGQMASNSFASTLNSNITGLGLTDCAAWIQTASINNGYPCLKGVGVGSDTTPPAGSYSLSKSAWTCKPVKITVTATDAGSGVASITLPDGTVVSAATATYTVTDNGTYNFTLADNAGNTCTYPVTVSNIDKAVSVTHEQTIAYTIDPNSSTLSGGAITLTNNDPHIGVAVYLNSLSTSGIAAVAPDAVASWNVLNAAQTASSMAIAVGVSNAADANWYSVARGAPAYSTDLASPVLIGVIKPGRSVTLNVSAKYGLAWASQKTVTHTLTLSYQACDTD